MSATSKFLTIARNAVAEGADLLTNSDVGHIHEKIERDFVTELDLRIQDTMQQRLMTETPTIRFLGEETSGSLFDDRGTGNVWTLDPIDGTSNVIHGLPFCGVSLALVRDGTPIVGVISAPFLGLEYYAEEHGGAFCNESPIRAGKAESLRGAVISLGDYAVGPDSARRNRQRFAITEAIVNRAERVRMFGSAALDLAWVAEGRTDGCVIMSNKQWDVAAGVLIAREGGATVTDSDGSPHSQHSQHTVAANPTIANELVRLIADT
ncbi:inositol monophosphatase family protein [Nocardia sp. CNY236]|uniref:inositol monophosphatase family protein n=1 Tax=Nocardia sp. CNY236 TaxID=1169152 RepID=UPI0004176F26|nr:inositol monophosphatase family protein [Nocardia sp. CNY236]